MKPTTQTSASDRIFYFDYLRIFATLAVMIIHISAQKWQSTSVLSFQWQTFNFYHSITRWSVPIFVMVSGALFLDGNKSIAEIYKKNILRIVTSFIFWSILYAMISFAQGSSIINACEQVIRGHYHMWFLFMIVGLYLIIPLIRKIVESRELTKYFLALSLVFTFIIPQGITLVSLFNKNIEVRANLIIQDINFHFTLGYICYFVLGYYLSKVDISKKARYIIYILSIIGFASTFLGSSFIAVYTNESSGLMFDNFTLNVMLQSLGVFVFFKYNVGTTGLREKKQTSIAKLSKYSFGAYLVHAMIIEQLDNILGLNTISFYPIFSTIVIALITFVTSFVISYICNRIPVLNKYIV